MRDPRFVAEHRGGLLSKADHQQLMQWAIVCIEHLLQSIDMPLHPDLQVALTIAGDWQKGLIQTGPAMQSARRVHALARTLDNPQEILLARAIGHTVATAHMADHALGAALYGLKMLKQIGHELESEQQWQIQQISQLDLHPELSQLLLQTLEQKSKAFGLFKKDKPTKKAFR